MSALQPRVVYARNCSVEIMDEFRAREFVRQHHRSGDISAKTTSVGLFKGQELLGVMQFCLPRTPRKLREYSTEMVRMCFADGVRVVGGASKMFNHYLRSKDAHDVFTYQDTTGQVSDVYEQCGMTLVSQDKSKQYLVAPGVELVDAQIGSTMHTVPFVVSQGPDAILGTGLGERIVHKRWHLNRNLVDEDCHLCVATTPVSELLDTRDIIAV